MNTMDMTQSITPMEICNRVQRKYIIGGALIAVAILTGLGIGGYLLFVEARDRQIKLQNSTPLACLSNKEHDAPNEVKFSGTISLTRIRRRIDLQKEMSEKGFLPKEVRISLLV